MHPKLRAALAASAARSRASAARAGNPAAHQEAIDALADGADAAIERAGAQRALVEALGDLPRAEGLKRAKEGWRDG